VALRWACALLLTSLIRSVDGAAILLSLLKELQKQSQAIGRLSGISAQWCGDASHQNVGMAQVIQGQLDDATIAVQQIKSDEKRLQSELRLAESTQKQREQQLQDATATSKFAAMEFASEQDQLSKTLQAASHASRLVRVQMRMDAEQQQQLGSADVVVNNLMQTSSDHMTDAEKKIMQEYVNDPTPSQAEASGARPQELLKVLTNLQSRVEREKGLAAAENQVMSLRLWSFTDHLNSSIMESMSQSASISMEMAQRKREHTRLDGKISTLNDLLGKVETSRVATVDTCKEDALHKAEIGKFITEESESVRSTLKRNPSLSSELLFDLSSVLPPTPNFPSFLQLRGKSKLRDPVGPVMHDLDGMAKMFPSEESMFEDAERALASMKKRSVASDAARASKSKSDNNINGFASSSIQDIYAFLKSDEQGGGATLPGEERMLLRNSGDLDKVTGLYKGLVSKVHSEEKAVDDQLKWCSSIARDAKVDSDAVARSLKWTTAKLNLVQVAMAEYQSTITFNKAQENSLQARSAQLTKFSDVEDGQIQQASGALKQYSQQLVSLITELSSRSTPDERKGADVVRVLLDKVEAHQNMLLQWQTKNKERREAVEAAWKSVRESLSESSKQSKRRLIKLKLEEQVLTSLVASKSKDKELSERYVALSADLCSPKNGKALQAKGSRLRKELAAIQKSLLAISAPLP